MILEVINECSMPLLNFDPEKEVIKDSKCQFIGDCL